MLSHRIRKRIALPFVAFITILCAAAPAAFAQETSGDTTVWLPENVSTAGGSIDALFNFILYLTGAVGIAVMVTLVVFLVQYRHKPGRHAKFIHGNNRLETVWTLIPTAILALIAVFSQATWSQVKGYDNMPDPKTDPDVVQVEVIGRQFKWYFHYPGDDGVMGPRKWALVDPGSTIGEELVGLHRGENIVERRVMNPDEVADGKAPKYKDFRHWGEVISENDSEIVLQTQEFNTASKSWEEVRVTIAKGEDGANIVDRNQAGKDDLVTPIMYIPVNRKVYLHISSVDVIHSFFLPNFRIKQDAMPGLSAQAWLESTKTSAEVIGTESDGSPKPFEIVCAELCGPQHYTMKGLMYVVTDEQFDAWIEEQKLYLPEDF